MKRPPRSFLLVVAMAALVAGCGSSGGGGGSSSEPSQAASSEPSGDPGLSPEPVPSEGGGAGSSGIPEIADGPWGAGTAKAEISGDVTATIEGSMLDGLGYTAEGLTVFVFTDEAGSGVINITLSQDEATGFGISSTTANVSTAGTWGEAGCEIDVTKSDDSGIAATFSCADIPAIAVNAATAYTIDVAGEFEVAR